jgi:hypothetical protein
VFHHEQRVAHGVQRVGVIAFHAQHAERVHHGIRIVGEVLVDFHFVTEGNHRGFPRIGCEQLRKQNAAAAQLVNDGAGIRAGLHRDHQIDGIRGPIHLYLLRHIVVVEDQVVLRQAVDEMSFGIGDGGRRHYQRNGAFELRPAWAGQHEDRRSKTHSGNPSSFRAKALRDAIWVLRYMLVDQRPSWLPSTVVFDMVVG